MRWLAALVVFATAGVEGAASDLEKLRGCVESVKATQVEIMGRLPIEIFSADRRLFHMSMGIPFLEENYRRLAEKLAAEHAPLERILLGNSLEGCLLFAQRYRDRAVRFSSVLATFLAMVAVLTLRAFSSILPPYAKPNLPPPPDARAAS